jgi:oxygen-dependent protoporphyrinogen oxidase
VSERSVEALVVGAGVAGLAAARDLSRAGVGVLIVDANSRPGGVMQTDSIDGYRVETGPNTFQAKPALWSFVRRHGLEASLRAASPESRSRSLFRDDRLVPLPRGPLSAVATPLLSPRGKLRLLAEPFVRAGDPTGESVHEFVARRLGPEVATNLVGAFLTGVYAGDERALGVEAVFPGLVELEREHGSLFRGGLARAFAARRSASSGDATRIASDRAPRHSGSWSSPDGLGGLARDLAAGLPEPPLLESRVVALARDRSGWRIEVAGPSRELVVRARSIVVATPAYAAAELLASLDGELSKLLAAIEYAPIAAVALAADPSEVRHEIEGFGFIVPRAAKRKLLGCLFMSRLFEGRAPAGRELLHGMLGGVRWPAAVRESDADLVEIVLADLDRCLGLRAPPRTLAIRRWPRAIPQPGREHVRCIAAAQRRVDGLPGLALAGSYLAGVSVADALASGVRAANRIVTSRGGAAGSGSGS